MSIALSVHGLGKRYLLSHQSRERYTALRDVLATGGRRLAGRLRHPFAASTAGPGHEEFWALRDVDFEVRQGERVGIVGRNGAGKSTLLKLLSRITDPTTGRIAIHGRIASLLEVGTGFHPELTGRENIYLNGAILGMTRAEIRRRFDDIVAFAGVERFLDTPVKRYSSGMYVRLAFAVAAHLEPEILVVDEVLAVGDAEFQRRCLGKMSEISNEGRTVLFVSHNMAAIQTLCPRSIQLASGGLVADGPTEEVVAGYLARIEAPAPGAANTHIQEGLALAHVGLSQPTPRSGDPVEVVFTFQAMQPGEIRECALLLHSASGIRVAIVDLRESARLPFAFGPGRFILRANIAALPLVEGSYSLGIYLSSGTFSGNLLDLRQFDVLPRPGRGDFVPYAADARGLLVLEASSWISSDFEPEAF